MSLFRLVGGSLSWSETPYFHKESPFTIGAKVASESRNVNPFLSNSNAPGVPLWQKKSAKQYLTPSPKEVCTIALKKENIEKICECFMKGFCCYETFNIKDIFTMWSTEGENIAYKRPSEIPCLWNTITQLSKMEQNCENLHLKDKHFA